MIVVTGATGKLGRLVVQSLLGKVPADRIAVAVRTPDKAADMARLGVQVRKADYDEPYSLNAAFEGASKVLLISSSQVGKRTTQHAVVIKAARAAGVRHVVYTSMLRAPTSALALATEHRATEDRLRASGMAFTILRNGWYTENYTENLGPALEHGVILGSAGNGRIAAATRADLAEAAAAVLAGEGHEGQAYELGGDAPFTMPDLAATVSQVSGKAVAYRDLPPNEYHAALVGFGLPAPYADLLVDSDVGISHGELDDATGDLHRLLGRATTPLADAVASALRA